MTDNMTLRQRINSRAFWIKQIRDLGILSVALFAIASYMQRDMIDGQAPQLSAVTVQQQPFILATSTKPTLVYFWGTWCPACKVTSPMVNSLASHNEYQVISIAVASGSDQDIIQFMYNNDLQFPVINEANMTLVPHQQSLSQQWGANAFPAIYIIDNQQQIRFVTSGITTQWGLKLRLWLSTFL
ncbi:MULTISPECIES: protein disulfide oxidoreductase [Pseudomonadati]|uniref:Protein disulfide oxidoreductase n=1 Tax=Shewanella aestuarii TaxID=1028752 RepID=A0ABT0L2M5_9GAMM|nr:protein disulfide oxidoreductase [Shewanella aestuarii]MCL1117682.1 protein disulfide oxidoreductase [Shewanella aestuarii]GGN76456.1 protein disulfide oxidoreductase [Shewanella aestuarii]